MGLFLLVCDEAILLESLLWQTFIFHKSLCILVVRPTLLLPNHLSLPLSPSPST